jgi:AcrR family transcriptional regulator
MKTFDSESFQMQYQIADAAADLYAAGAGDFTLKDVAKKVDLDVGEIFNYFPDKKSILQFYYSSHVVRYEFMIDDIEDFESYTISEKLSNFAYASFDMFGEKRLFVEGTFDKLILGNCTKTDFEDEIERLIKRFLENDKHISLSSSFALNSFFYAFLRRKHLGLIKFWINDESKNYELTMQLTDKLTSFLQELMYNPIADKSFDLAKFMYANRKAFLTNIPLVKQIFSKIEIR